MIGSKQASLRMKIALLLHHSHNNCNHTKRTKTNRNKTLVDDDDDSTTSSNNSYSDYDLSGGDIDSDSDSKSTVSDYTCDSFDFVTDEELSEISEIELEEDELKDIINEVATDSPNKRPHAVTQYILYIPDSTSTLYIRS